MEVIPADDQICAAKFLAERFELVFAVNFISPAACAVSDGHGDSHFRAIGGPADVCEAALGFQIEIDDVFFGHGEMGWLGRWRLVLDVAFEFREIMLQALDELLGARRIKERERLRFGREFLHGRNDDADE